MIRVILAEDVPMLRGALVAMLDFEDDLHVVAQVGRGDEVVPTALRTRPDVAVLDIDLPGCDGLVAARDLHTALPDCRTLVLTGLGQPGHLLRALHAHVHGFLLKNSPAEALADAVRRVAAGHRVLDPDLVAAALDVGASPLTDREADVLRAAEDGARTEDIARRLHLAPTTVRNYLSNAITKTGTRNRVEALRLARDAGWL